MELYIFDRNINFKGIVENYFSLRRLRRYSRCGEFELHCSFDFKTLELLEISNIVWKSGDIEAGYITHRGISLDQEGKEVIYIRGKFLTGYLGQRIIWGIENINNTTELAIRDLISKNAINPSDPKRKIELVKLGAVKNYKESINYQVSYKNLLEESEKLALLNGLGIRTLFNIEEKKIVFDIYKGVDRTKNQDAIPPTVFSKELENVLSQEYINSLDNFRNVALVAGEGEGDARILEAIGDSTGLDRYELFVDANDLQSTELTTQDYKGKLVSRGNSKLSESERVESFDSEIDLRSNLVYKKDFDLGDVVTCKSKKWNVTVDTRITEIEEVYEESGLSISVVFGENLPTLIDKIKREVR